MIESKDDAIVEYLKDRIKLFLIEIRHHKENISTLENFIRETNESIKIIENRSKSD